MTGGYRWTTNRIRAGGRVHQPDGNREGQFLVKPMATISSAFWPSCVKEFIQMRRDRLTFGMMVGIPLIQLILFGYAINSDPKHLPTAVYSADNSVFLAHALSGLCATAATSTSPARRRTRRKSRSCSREGTVQFAVNIPVDFSRKLLRGEQPDLLLEADATDPVGRRLRHRRDRIC